MQKYITVANPRSYLDENAIVSNLKMGEAIKVKLTGYFRKSGAWGNRSCHKDVNIILFRIRYGLCALTEMTASEIREKDIRINSEDRLSGLINAVRDDYTGGLRLFTTDITRITKLSYSKKKMSVSDIFDPNKLETIPGKKNEVGAELELEGTGENWPEKFAARLTCRQLVQDVGIDCSVASKGTEIRFAHPSLDKWRLNSIKAIIDFAKSSGFKQGASAGQHVHISHEKIRKAVFKFETNLSLMNEFLKPISCRQSDRYGLENDIYRDQTREFGTLEIRCWESTTNPSLFRKRIIFSKMLVDYLVGDDKVEKIWKKMPLKMAKLYVDMLFTENPHMYGISAEEALKKMSGWAINYAKKTYKQGE